jgi:Holliday junction resolvase RusA-like endonuclease
MGRQREPLSTRHFQCAIFGKPVSVQTETTEKLIKNPKYPRWRESVRGQIDAAADMETDNRGFELMISPVSVRLIWYTPAVNDQADPDVDNIAKPYLDGLVGTVIHEDRLVRILRIVKADINTELQDIPGVLEAKASPELNQHAEFVMLTVEEFTEAHLMSFGEESSDE